MIHQFLLSLAVFAFLFMSATLVRGIVNNKADINVGFLFALAGALLVLEITFWIN